MRQVDTLCCRDRQLPARYEGTCSDRGNVTRVATRSGNTDYTCDSAARVSTRTYPNQVKASYTYDTASRVTQMKYEDVSGLQPVLREQYDFAYTGAYQSYTRTENSGMKWTFTFDKLRRLIDLRT